MKKLALLALLISGCAKKPGTYKHQTTTAESGLRAQADALWAERGDKAKLQEALTAYEQIFNQEPENQEVVAYLVRGWYFMGDAHESEIEAKKAAWQKAVQFGNACLNINKDYKAFVEKSGNKAEAAKKYATKSDVPCMYWTASALGKWAKSSGFATLLKHKSTVFAYISKLEKVDPDFYHGGAHRYWGAYYTLIPVGKDFNRSKAEFDKSLKKSPHYLGTRVLLAQYWAVNTQNHEAFDEAIQYVMAADPTMHPDLIPENTAEKKKAEALWKQRSDKFISAPEPKPLQNPPPQKSEEPPAEETPSEEASPAEETPSEEASPAEETSPAEGSDSPAPSEESKSPE